MGFKVGEKVKTSWWNQPHGSTGIVSNDYSILSLSKQQLRYWKKNFTLVKWDLDNQLSGELTDYLHKF